MCKFVNTLSGKNAQSSALGASATARFRPHPLYALRAFLPAFALSPCCGVPTSNARWGALEGGAGGGLIFHKPLQRYNTSAPFVGQTLPIMKGIFANYLAMSKISRTFAFVYSGNDDA